jgi:tRNA threonylcarbamoyladenosine biosynthesis protein TsaB
MGKKLLTVGMKTVLIINTSDNKEIKVGLRINGKEELVKHPVDSRKAQAVLPLIEKLLIKHQLELKDLTAIEVNPGSGSFVGLRVGISIANTLGTFLDIPINGQKPGVMVEPVY